MSSNSIKDEQLVRSYIKGKDNSLNILINRHRQRIMLFIISKVRDQSLAEDIFQETFFKVIKTLKKGKHYNEQGKFLPWVMRIAYNLSMDYFRKVKKQKLVRSRDNFNIFDVIKDNSVSIEDEIIQKKILSDVKEIINKLPKDQKRVLTMRYYFNMSFNEIANDCDISINTALGRMRYALINLRKIIKKEGVRLTAD
tara:strand:+ start:65 stop:655 length:591 start_codon:yes stop_codon:yes gene_type:complete